MSMKIVYVAHPYGGDPENLKRARRWLQWCFKTNFPVFGFVAPWIDACESIPETPRNREAGLAFDCQIVEQCDEVWLVGGRVSDGMKIEAKHAKRVVDMTELGAEPPSC